MKLQLAESKGTVQVLDELLSEKLPIKEAYSIAKSYMALAAEVTIFEKARMSLIKKYSLLDDNGNPKTEDGKYMIEDEEAYGNEYKELLTHEVEVDIKKIDIDSLQEAKMSALDLLKIRKIVSGLDEIKE